MANALKVSSNPRLKRRRSGAVGYLYASNNDPQHTQQETLITSSVYTGGNGGGHWLGEDNLCKASIVFSVRRLIKPTWLNDRDQFLQPTMPLNDEFKTDCLVWMLFNGSNLTAGADGIEWEGREWSLTNHFVPYTEAEVGASGRFESDFMVQQMRDMHFSSEAQAVLNEGRSLWSKFHETRFPTRIRNELKLNRPDAGWYQIRKALELYQANELTDFEPLKQAYGVLGDKLRPQVYAFGFLPS